MGEKLDKMRATLQTKMDAVVDQMDKVKTNIEVSAKGAEADIKAKLDAAKVNLSGKKQDAITAKDNAKAYVEDKKDEVEGQVAQWKANRESAKLLKRAEKAEAYAEDCIVIALEAAAGADLAILDSVAAWLDVEDAAS